MHINEIDLNLLRLFDAVHRHRSVSRAAEQLDLTQPAASQGLTRLRGLLNDPLFMRAPGGVQPTPRAERLAEPVRQALATLEGALADSREFEPLRSRRTFQLHMSDIGESRFLPPLMAALREQAPGVRVEVRPWPRDEISDALHAGRIDFAFGFLPMVKDSQRLALLDDRYVLVLRRDHPFLRRRRSAKAQLAALGELDFVAVRTHTDTRRILQLLELEERLRLVTEHFLVLPAIVQSSDLAALVPRDIAEGFGEGHAIVEPEFPLRDFTVSLHWSRRFEAEPGHRWLREVIEQVFRRKR
ncbi:LysR family transcriptional regulator [Ramlibacter rhizophilus]|uniref:LysR family transcriptional regulator n=1 Tax=Ramlibacter rhizophilus TaxID=1781167 RepID=UPI00197D1D6E|nr:LysR family transcriptional regulator [Ramlibacter rhizophilus]